MWYTKDMNKDISLKKSVNMCDKGQSVRIVLQLLYQNLKSYFKRIVSQKTHAVTKKHLRYLYQLSYRNCHKKILVLLNSLLEFQYQTNFT